MIKINLLEPYKKLYYKQVSDSIKLFSFEGFMFLHLNCKYANFFYNNYINMHSNFRAVND